MAGTPIPAPSNSAIPPNTPEQKSSPSDILEDAEASEVVIFHIKECFVYKIPPRKSAASHRADDWNINKWAWEGALRVVSKGDECVIRLEDSKTGELFAQAPIFPDQPVPVEAVIDSSRFFVLRIEDNSAPAPKAGKAGARHAFVGIGFRERPSAFDFQEAVYDHVKYLNKKKEAQELDKEYASKPAADYSLKEGQTLKLDIKRPSRATASHALSRLKLHSVPSPSTPGAIPPLPPVGSFPVSFPPAPTSANQSDASVPVPSAPLRQTSGEHVVDDVDEVAQGSNKEDNRKEKGPSGTESQRSDGVSGPEDDDFGDFQAA